MIRLVNATKIYNAGKSSRFTAVDDINIEIPPLKLTILKGPSGSGKTTLLSLIGCMIRPTSGRITLHGIRATFAPPADDMGQIEITSLPERFLTEIRRTTFGFVFQQFNLIKGISVLENVLLPVYPTGKSQATARKRGVELLELLGMQRHAASRVEWLSGGELQRVAIARALINDPAIIIADEPTAHLDSKLSQEFMEIVGTMKSAGKTIIIASHDPLVYEAKIADSVVEMRDGRITAVRNAG